MNKTFLKNTSLKTWNTFQVDVTADYSFVLERQSQLPQIFNAIEQKVEFYMLGDGANILFTKDIHGLVIKNQLKGITLVQETETDVLIKVASGEDWHEFVKYGVNNQWSGVENLAYIPGTVGAAVAQNIAAYGHNIEDSIVRVEGIDLETRDPFQFTREECRFNYRDSLFKSTENHNLFITNVVFKLSKIFRPTVNYFERYLSLEEELGKEPQNSLDIFNAVIRLRKKKLPDWTRVGTAGSFFKNPIVTKETYELLQKDIKELQCYPVEKLIYSSTDDDSQTFVKIPAARLLDELGWRGKRIGRVGTFEKQALVIINLGDATGQEILEFSEKMKNDIRSHFDIVLEPEVKIY